MKDLEDCIRISGGKPLKGTVRIQGSKNAALPMMAAALLHRGISVLKGCPKITDVRCMEEILCHLGANCWWQEGDLYLDCTNAKETEIPAAYTEKMRSSVILLGAMLGRNGRGRIGYPGGCVIGKRPVDLHLFALRSLGAHICESHKFLDAVCRKMTGAPIVFEKKSVGATQQAILAAVLAEGETVLTNCAQEPEILWLCRFLQKMGALIRTEGSGRIIITGVKQLHGAQMTVPPDRIAAGTYICAAGITGGEILLENFPEGQLDAFLDVYRKMGGQYRLNSGKLMVSGREVKNPVPVVKTQVYPGFPTDLQSPLMALFTKVKGVSCIREQIFEDRYKAVPQLVNMGAHIVVSGEKAVVHGGFPLCGCKVHAQELRGGAALILAALSAEGETCMDGYSFVRRGYEHICEDLYALGADIR